MDAPKAQRLSGYGLVYDELFAGVPGHPQHTRLQNDDRGHVEAQLRALRRHLGEAQVLLEIGAGDCRLSFTVCKVVRRVIAIDVSDRLLNIDQAPENFSFAFGRHEHSGASRKRRFGLQQSVDGASASR
jgi:hypothetical protein